MTVSRRTTTHPAGRRATLEKLQPLDLFAWLALAQGGYYAATGLWALVDIRLFQKVTGPKTDLWLVKTVGVLVMVIGAVLGVAGLRRRPTPEVALLAAGNAAGLTAIDIVYVARRRISPIYLLDALAELALIAAWAFVWSCQEHATARSCLAERRIHQPGQISGASSATTSATTIVSGVPASTKSANR